MREHDGDLTNGVGGLVDRISIILDAFGVDDDEQLGLSALARRTSLY